MAIILDRDPHLRVVPFRRRLAGRDLDWRYL